MLCYQTPAFTLAPQSYEEIHEDAKGNKNHNGMKKAIIEPQRKSIP